MDESNGSLLVYWSMYVVRSLLLSPTSKWKLSSSGLTALDPEALKVEEHDLQVRSKSCNAVGFAIDSIEKWHLWFPVVWSNVVRESSSPTLPCVVSGGISDLQAVFDSERVETLSFAAESERRMLCTPISVAVEGSKRSSMRQSEWHSYKKKKQCWKNLSLRYKLE